MGKLPEFTPDGVLPPGDYPLTFDELSQSYLVDGPAGRDSWDRDWRRYLVQNLRVLVQQLWQVGMDSVYIDGSFVEDKDHPNDIDGYFHCDPGAFATGQLQRELNLLDPRKVWTWDPASRRPFPGSAKKQLPMWIVYRVELYPHYPGLFAGQDEHGVPLEFPAFFRKSRRDGRPKGIVELRRA